MSQFQSILNHLERQTSCLRRDLAEALSSLIHISGESSKTVILLMKNKFGFTKEQAKKLFYDFRSKGSSEEEPTPPKRSSKEEPKTVDEKINKIMRFHERNIHKNSTKSMKISPT